MVAAALFLVACGGASSENPASNTPGQAGSGTASIGSPKAPAHLVVADVPKVGPLAIGLSESVLQLADLADRTVRAVRMRNRTSYEATCDGGGQISYSVTDTNADGRLSDSESVKVTFARCYQATFGEVVSGTIDVQVHTGSHVKQNTVAGLVSLPAAFKVGAEQSSSPLELTGSLRFESVSAPFRSTLSVSQSDSNNLSATIQIENRNFTERILSPQFSKDIQYDLATIAVSLTYTLDSDYFQGRIDVASARPFRSFINQFPDQGRLVLSGSEDQKIEILVEPTATYLGTHYQTTHQLPDDPLSRQGSSFSSWYDASTGYLWWDPQTRQVRAETGYQIGSNQNSKTELLLGKPENFYLNTLVTPTPVNGPITLQFSRPQGNCPVSYELSAFMHRVPISVETRGARVVVTPMQTLNYDSTYYLVRTGNYCDAAGAVLQTAAQINIVTGTNLIARPVLNINLGSPTLPLELDASASTSIVGPIVRYLWRQTVGTAATINSPTAARTGFTPATPTIQGELLVFELEIESQSGEVARQTVSYRSIADLAGQTASAYFRSVPGEVQMRGQSDAFSSASGEFRFSIDRILNELVVKYSALGVVSSPAVSWELRMQKSDGTIPTAGVYDPASRYGFGGAIAAHGMLFRLSGSQDCGFATGRFSIHELNTDVSGEVSRLAVDFEQIGLPY